MITYDVKFVTCDETLQINPNDFKTFKYETKKKSEESIYDVGKKNYYERRGGHWRAPRPRQVRQLELKLREKTVVACEWTTDNLLSLVFSSGAIAYLSIKSDTLDVTQILFDRYCVGKLSSQNVTGVILCKTHLLFVHADRLATLITFGKNNCNLPCRIVNRDPHLQSIELGGGARRAERRVSWRISNDLRVLIWSSGGTLPAPWTPQIEDHANLHLYQVTGQQMSLVAYHQLENETLSADLSHKGDNVVHVVEQAVCHKNGVNLDWLRYDVPIAEADSRNQSATKLCSLRESAVRVSLVAPVRAVRRAACDSRLIAACIDGSLHIIDHVAGLLNTTRAGFIATDVRWSGQLVLAGEEGGRLQCFDRALALLHHDATCIDFSTHFRESRRMQILSTRSASCGSIVLMLFTNGPLTLLRVTHPQLLTAWIRGGYTSNAVSLLRAMDWDHEGIECLRALNVLICAALRSGSEAHRCEGVAQAALGAYLAPHVALPAAARRLAPHVHDLARKFFHHLLRRGRVEKALSLAVDLCAWDLCRDVHAMATRLSLPDLAGEAATLATHYAAHNSPASESSSCSRCSSYSRSEDETSASSEPAKTAPPPLPRVSLPTVMSVPITHQEPTSTSSIRPNLHQYLERDNSIWNTDVKDRNSYEVKTNTLRWNLEGLANYKPLRNLMPISESQSIDGPQNEGDAQYKYLYQTELRKDAPDTLYRYKNSCLPSSNMKAYRNDDLPEKSRVGEKNKVKFSDTVTIAVVSESSGCPEPGRELADSLPLCLSAFAAARPPANVPQTPPKIKVVHFGMV